MGSPRKTPAERRAALVARIEKAKAAHEVTRARAGIRRTRAAWDAASMAYDRWNALRKQLAEMDTAMGVPAGRTGE